MSEKGWEFICISFLQDPPSPPPKDACKNLAFHFQQHWLQDKHAGNAGERSALFGLEGGNDLYE